MSPDDLHLELTALNARLLAVEQLRSEQRFELAELRAALQRGQLRVNELQANRITCIDENGIAVVAIGSSPGRGGSIQLYDKFACMSVLIDGSRRIGKPLSGGTIALFGSDNRVTTALLDDSLHFASSDGVMLSLGLQDEVEKPEDPEQQNGSIDDDKRHRG